MTWYQAAWDPNEPYGKQWVVVKFTRYGPLGRDLHTSVISNWPTRHEAEGHARKAWEALK